ncbi:molybdopterin molybdotransferase MoeA [Solihabitans fulvus]|uniref:Molybdopterin molybdenumtransferase n=2 Tax=Solihabitans fulvus TaxID=1892852 RepID=A0A5B2XH04_9PSEU|nr:gephyrin-like molybdotransferase Glp [Solihabitans fulvus]KAA2262486.1 molybdopterin molybdotransferase MoeA [Solihabitans fulvus]
MPVRRLPLADCLGLVLAEDLVAPISLPPFDNSAMDGYAVRAADVAGASAAEPVELPVADDIPAGRVDLVPLRPGTAQRIMTGAALPAGADAIVQVEHTDGDTELVTVFAPAADGLHVRRAASDVAAGARVLAAGQRLGPAQLGLAAALGCRELPVRRRPRVLVLSTGSELVEPGEPLRPGQIYESNGVMLAAAVREVGGEAELLRFVPDDVAAFHATIAGHLADADVVITSGGVSAGAYEVVKDAFTGRGVEFVKIAMQPGAPQGSGRYEGVPVVTLPGNPVSAHVSFEVFVRPALRAAMGHRVTDRPTAVARITAAITSPAGRRQYRRGAYDPSSGRVVTPVGGPGSHLLSSLAIADCLIELPEDVTAVGVGDEVTVILLEG